MTSLAGAAVELASGGWLSHPVQPQGKRPICRGGFTASTTDPDIIRRWWQRWPNANIGTPTGAAFELVVLDVDERSGGYESLVEVQERHGCLPETLTVETGGGGLHLYFRHPGGRVKSLPNALGPGLDIRGDGGCVVLPPSIHASGRRYRWRDTSVPMAEMPAWLAELVRYRPPAPRPRCDGPVEAPDRYVRVAVERELAAVRSAREPGRNDQLNRSSFSIGQLVGDGCLDREVAWTALVDAGLDCALPEREVRCTVRSGLEAGIANPRGLRVGGRR